MNTNLLRKAGSVALKAGSAVVDGTMYAAKKLNRSIPNQLPQSFRPEPFKRVTEDAVAGLSMITRPRPGGEGIFDREFTGLGKIMAGSIVVGGMASNAMDERNKNDMGRSDGVVRSATPGMKQYLEMKAPDISAGATGDLVFALNATRSTGYLG